MRVVDENLGVIDRPSVGVMDEMGLSMMMISSWTPESRQKTNDDVRQTH